MTVMTEGKTPPPFGTSAKRFSAIGFHPLLDVRPETFKNPELGPGHYDWNKPKKIVSKVPRWKKQKEVEEFSRRLGFKNDHILKKAKWMNSINGPGWHDVRFPLPGPGYSFSKSARFRVSKAKRVSVPGPGFYGKNHVPWTTKEEKSHAKGFSFSVLPPFEQKSCSSRSLNPQGSYHLPPNRYKFKSFIHELLSKRVSKRGPYDIFSIERFPDPESSKIPMMMPKINSSDLSHSSNSFKGKFLLCGKDSLITSRLAITNLTFSKKNPLDPGPGYYNPYKTPVINQAYAPFNTSVLKVWPGPRRKMAQMVGDSCLKLCNLVGTNQIIRTILLAADDRDLVKSALCGFSPPPGRYKIEPKKRIPGNGMKSVFLSKVKRDLPLPEKLSWFE